MKRTNLVLCGVSALVAATLACSSAKPATPVAPTSTGPAAAADGSTLKVSAPSPQSPVNDFKFTTANVTLTSGAAAPQFAPGVPLQYQFQVLNAANQEVASGTVGSPSWTVTATLAPNTRYTWRVRSVYQGESGPWSTAASFVTLDPAIVNDVLTNGSTVGHQVGGRFLPGQGWQSLGLTDGIDYVVATCSACRLACDA